MIEPIFLPDGRKAERRTHMETDGSEIEEIFAQPPSPMTLISRTTKKKKWATDHEKVEHFENGELVKSEILEGEIYQSNVANVDDLVEAIQNAVEKLVGRIETIESPALPPAIENAPGQPVDWVNLVLLVVVVCQLLGLIIWYLV